MAETTVGSGGLSDDDIERLAEAIARRMGYRPPTVIPYPVYPYGQQPWYPSPTITWSS